MDTLLASFQDNTDTIGMKYIHSYLSKNQVDSNMLFVPDYKDFHPFEEFLSKFKPKIIGISLMSEEFHKSKKFSQSVKKRFPGIVIVWGGIHPSIDPEECLKYADYVFTGESEQVYLKFVKAILEKKSVHEIPNLAYKSPAGIKINKLVPLTENLDDLPFPEHFPTKSFILHKGNIVKLNKKLFKEYTKYSGKFYSIITTRGCPFSCTYCCNSFFSKLYRKNKIRYRSVENVIEELKTVVKLFPNLVYINFQDDNFLSHDVKWMEEFAGLYKRDIKKDFICRSTPAHLIEEKVSILKKAGLSWIFIGLQSGSSRINKGVYKRFVSNEKFIEATKMVRKHNVAGYYDVILDNPYETEEDILETIKVVLEIPKPYMLQLFSLCFYQGTELHDKAVEENLKVEDPFKKNYSKYKPTFLNKVIRLCPLFPKKFIELLIKNRKSKSARMFVNFIQFPAILTLESIVWLRLILISFDYNIFKATKMIVFFIKRGFAKAILRVS